MASPQGWLIVSDDKNRIECHGVAKESDSGLIALTLRKANKSEGRLELRSYNVLVKPQSFGLLALYYLK